MPERNPTAMAVDSNFSFPILAGSAWVASSNTANPGMSALSTLPAWNDCGGLDQSGLSESPAQTRTDWKRWGSISTYNSVITDIKHEFSFTCLESNPVVLGLAYRAGTVLTPTGTPVNEVQTVTISGGPTGGSFFLDFGGAITPALPYNATASAVQTALQNLTPIGAGNVVVTGSAGGPYTVTFQGNLAATNVAQLTSSNDFTGGTSPNVSVVTTTGGSSGSTLNITDDTTGQRDVRAFTFDLVGTGGNHERFWCPTAEITAVAAIKYDYQAPAGYQFTVTAYPNSAGIAVQRAFALDAVRLGL
jgi:hypothetical protein